MPTHFRTLSLLTFGASLLLGACTIIEDPVTPINPPERRQRPHATPAPPPATAATPAPTTPPQPQVAVPAPPVATPIPGTTATPNPGTTTTPPPGKTAEPAPPVATPGKRRPIMRIPRLPPKLPVPGGEAKPPKHEQPVPPSKREPAQPVPSSGRADGAACSTSSQCASGICEGMGCGWDQGKCAPVQRSCTRDLRLFCGCDGKDFQASSTCPGRVFLHPGSCNPKK